MDDFFPIPRPITTDLDDISETAFHIKLNYQVLIERMTRKLSLLLVLIIYSAIVTSYLFYTTSLGERIAPEENVTNDLVSMLDKIHKADMAMEKRQYQTLDNLNRDSKANINMDSFMTKVLDDKIAEENTLMHQLSVDFFNVYFARYVMVRLLIAIIIFTTLRFLIKIYYRIRDDRMELIMKEEALSTLLGIIDKIEGYDEDNPTGVVPRFTLLEDKIPSFPLERLFEYGNNRSKKSTSANEFSNTISALENKLMGAIDEVKEKLSGKDDGENETG